MWPLSSTFERSSRSAPVFVREAFSWSRFFPFAGEQLQGLASDLEPKRFSRHNQTSPRGRGCHKGGAHFCILVAHCSIDGLLSRQLLGSWTHRYLVVPAKDGCTFRSTAGSGVLAYNVLVRLC